MFNRITGEKENIRTDMPMWLQLAAAVMAITCLCVSLLTIFYYQNIKHEITETYLESRDKLILSEANNLNSYMNELSTYSVQGCYDSSFMRIIEKSDDLTAYDETYMSDQIKIYFYSRSDILEYNMHLLNSGRSFNKTMDRKRIAMSASEDIKSSKYYDMCISSPTFDGVIKNDKDSILFDYYHALLHIKSKSPMAITKLSVNNNLWDEFVESHNNPGEFICLVSDDGALIKSSDNSVFESLSDDEISRFFESASSKDSVTIGHGSYYVTKGSTSKRGLSLYAFLPENVLSSQLKNAAKKTVITSLCLLFIALFIIYSLVRALTKPLSKLSEDMIAVGEGDMSVRSLASGSKEIITLTASFNEMIEQLNELIRKNYVFKINEQKSQIMALEAQINPHYMYNTLQAISTEALINDQMNIYKMIDALAQGLRYSIKGEGLVPLEKEIHYTENYIYLQKLRMKDKLTVEISASDDARKILIPKISVQMLVENAIIHGIGKTKDTISIKISAYVNDGNLCITVWDNGEGFDDDTLADYKNKIKDITPGTDSIGLLNIASRLKIMYQDKALMNIDSVGGEYTEVSITIPDDNYNTERAANV